MQAELQFCFLPPGNLIIALSDRPFKIVAGTGNGDGKTGDLADEMGEVDVLIECFRDGDLVHREDPDQIFIVPDVKTVTAPVLRPHVQDFRVKIFPEMLRSRIRTGGDTDNIISHPVLDREKPGPLWRRQEDNEVKHTENNGPLVIDPDDPGGQVSDHRVVGDPFLCGAGPVPGMLHVLPVLP